MAESTKPALRIKIVKHVTKTQLKLDENGKPSYIRIDSAIYDAPPVKGERARKGNDGVVMAPPKLVDIYNYELEAEQTMIANEVFASELQQTYKDNSYVGKSFEVAKFKLQGKRYSGFTITEIEVEGAAPAPEQTRTVANGSATPTPAAPAKSAPAKSTPPARPSGRR